MTSIFEDGRAHAAMLSFRKALMNGTKPVEIHFDPVLDAGYKIAVRSLITSLTAEVVMGIDDIEAMSLPILCGENKK